MKKWKYLLAVSMLISGLGGCANPQSNTALPQPEVTEGIRGEQFGIDKNSSSRILRYVGIGIAQRNQEYASA